MRLLGRPNKMEMRAPFIQPAQGTQPTLSAIARLRTRRMKHDANDLDVALMFSMNCSFSRYMRKEEVGLTLFVNVWKFSYLYVHVLCILWSLIINHISGGFELCNQNFADDIAGLIMYKLTWLD